jgi:superfamily II DNA or RNA helicase
MIPVQLKSHQIPVYEQVTSQLDTHGRSLLAAMTGFGKTETAIKIIQDYVAAGKRVLVLAHGLKDLRQQFCQRLDKYNVPRLELDEGIRCSKAKDYQVVVALPHKVYERMDKMGEFDLICADEAHQFYKTKRKMYASIIAAHKGYWLLLTATHYGMETAEVKSFFSMEEALAIGELQDVYMRTLEVDVGVTDDDYTADNHLKEGLRADLKTRAIGDFLTPERLPALVVTHSQPAAIDIHAKLSRMKVLKGRRVALSTYHTDTDSTNCDAFKRGHVDVLVVVRRANLGFDMKELATVIDASYSQNVELVQQLVGRLTRVSSVNKSFIKLAPKGFEPDMRLICQTVHALGLADVYREWDGNYQTVKIIKKDEIETPTPPSPEPPRKPEPPKQPEPPTGGPQPPASPLPPEDPGVPMPPSPEPEPPHDDWRIAPDPELKDRQVVRQPWLAATFGEYKTMLPTYKGYETTLHRALNECREARGESVRDPDYRKQLLKEQILKTGKTPSRADPLSSAYQTYTKTGHPSYDHKFRKWVEETIGIRIKTSSAVSIQEKIRRTITAYKEGKTLPHYVSPAAFGFCQEARDALIAAGWDPARAKADGAAKGGAKIASESGYSLKTAARFSKKVACSNGNQYPSASEAARQLDMATCMVSRVCRGEQKSARGLTFWYVDDEGNKID